MASYDSNSLYYEIAGRLGNYPYPARVTRPCILAPPPHEMSLGPTEEMDPKLWGNLQHHIGLERVFAKLPFQEFFQLRLVCKDFNAKASDEKFLEANANPLSKKPFFCLVHSFDNWQIFLEYDKVSNEWHQLRVPMPNGTNGDHPPKWTAGGYLVFVDCSWPDDWAFIVFDLHTRMQHKLPPLSRDREYDREWNLEGLVVNQLDKTFRLVIGEMGTSVMNSRKIRTSVYDSVTKAWDQKFQPFPLLSEFEVFSPPPHGSVCHNGNLYVSMYDGPCIMSYDLATGVWSSFECPSFELSAVHLGCWDGRLYAISYRWDQHTGTVELYVHQLCEGSDKRWNEVCSIPVDLFNQLFETNGPSLAQNECGTILETYVQASFCDEYVFISVFLRDYFVVDSGCDGYKIWYSSTLEVPRRFALLNLETEKWELLDFPISKDRQRVELGVEDCGFAHRDRKRMGKKIKEMIKEKLKEQEEMRNRRR